MRRSWVGLSLVFVLAAAPGCALHRMGFERMAAAISGTASAFATDNDPEFVRAGAPSTLKMVEMLLDQEPRHPGLLLTACSGFTQYAYAFLQVDAEILEPSNPEAARDAQARGRQMYERARGYCQRAVDLSVPGLGAELAAGKTDLLNRAEMRDVRAMYWLAAAWGGSLALAPNPLFRIGEVGTLRALLRRALELNPSWERGAIHELMIALEGLPALAGGSPARAKSHFDQAVALSGGQSAFAYVTMATSVAQPAKDRAEFERLLKAALAVDVNTQPALRLANLIAQKRAKFLLSRTPQLF